MDNPLEGASKKQRLVIAGVIALGIGLVVYTRYRAGQQVGPAEAYPDQQQQGGGGGFSVSAPNQQVADQYDTAMKSAEADAANLQNSYLSEQLRQQKAQFDLGLKEHAAQADLEYGVQKSYADLVNTQVGAVRNAYGNKKLKMECGKGESTYIDVNGNLACKASGKKGIKSIGDTIGNGIQGIVGGYLAGFGAAAEGAGYAQGAKALGTSHRLPPAEQQTIGKPHPSTFV